MCKSFYNPCLVSSEVSAVLRSFQAFVAFCVSYADIVPMHIFPLPPLTAFVSQLQSSWLQLVFRFSAFFVVRVQCESQDSCLWILWSYCPILSLFKKFALVFAFPASYTGTPFTPVERSSWARLTVCDQQDAALTETARNLEVSCSRGPWHWETLSFSMHAARIQLQPVWDQQRCCCVTRIGKKRSSWRQCCVGSLITCLMLVPHGVWSNSFAIQIAYIASTRLQYSCFQGQTHSGNKAPRH